ncbi:hypothetical protein J5X84_24045 [Streptosporangiaceae bacterium NEAU-GS5]|nr:hypothetical protein [Streptosporangiaceae bacterium NEAU-GS5]
MPITRRRSRWARRPLIGLVAVVSGAAAVVAALLLGADGELISAVIAVAAFAQPLVWDLWRRRHQRPSATAPTGRAWHRCRAWPVSGRRS